MMDEPLSEAVCLACSKLVYTAVVNGIKTVLSSKELGRKGEAKAVLKDLLTYNITGIRVRYARPRVVSTDFENRDYPVLADHPCKSRTRPVPPVRSFVPEEPGF